MSALAKPAMERYLEWVAKNVDGLDFQLRSGASLLTVDEFAEFVGTDLPVDFVALYRWCDGQSDPAPTLFPNMRMLPLDDVRQVMESMAAMQDAGDFDDDLTHAEFPQLKTGWTNPAWVPFAGNDSGDYTCLDLDPGPAGSRGQVFFRWHDDVGWPIEAKSLTVWLEMLVDRIETREQPVTARMGCTDYPD